jgi:hypothetical protein
MFIQFKLQKLQFWPFNDQITVSFVRAAGVLAKGLMFDMPGV